MSRGSTLCVMMLASLSALACGTPASDSSAAPCQPAEPAKDARGGAPIGVGFPEQDDRVLPAKVAYLTFDDGPSEWTEDFLDILRDQAISATFFVTARQLKGPAGLDASYADDQGTQHVYRDVLRRVAGEGHVIGNHTVDHTDLASVDSATAVCELDVDERLINAALIETGAAPRALTLLRPPFGSPWYHTTAAEHRVAEQARVGALFEARGAIVLWTIDSSDSREWAQGESFSRVAGKIVPEASAPSYADKIARVTRTVLQDRAILAGDGAIILLHDTHNATRDALPALIAGLRAAGYAFATLEDYAQARWYGERPEFAARPALHGDADDGCVLDAVPVSRAASACVH